jgi:hypothetical protein
MMNITLEDLLELAEGHARKIILECHQSLPPSWVIVGREAGPNIFTTAWRDDIEKMMARVFLRVQMSRLDAVSYSMITEAWQATVSADEQITMPVRKMPKRKEVVIALACDRTRCEYRSWEVKRDWHERVVALEPLPGDYAKMESWMTSLLDKEAA